MARVVIIGAGLTGLSTAYHLEQAGFFDYTILEKESAVGGLCRSISQDSFTFDYTGHLLHINDDYVHSFIHHILGFEKLNTINRRSFIYSLDRYTRYPYQINLYGLPPETITECIEGFISRPHNKREPKTFHAWVIHNFGAGFGKHFFFPYQSKIFDYDVKKLSSSWTQRFVPPTSLHDMIKGAVSDNGEKTVGYNARFFYPKRGGIESLIHALHSKIKKPIQLNKQVARIDTKERRITCADGNSETFTHIINTMPLDHLFASLKTTPDIHFAHARKKLLCASVVNFNMGINRDDLSDKHWIYFPEHTYPFYRLGFTHNFASTMTPQGQSSLYGELSSLNKSPAALHECLKVARAQTKQLLKLEDRDLITEKIIHLEHAYVIYNAWRDRNLPILLSKLSGLSIHSIGRYGAWKYSSMQEAILDGKQCAEHIMKDRI